MSRSKRLLKARLHEYPGLAFPTPDGLERFAGAWNLKAFGNLGPLIVELGAGRGRFLVELAEQLPEACFLGVEIKADRCTRIAEKVAAARLRNVRVVCTPLVFLRHMLGEGECERFFVNCPDPWPKARHARRRMLHREMLAMLRPLLVSRGWIHLRTDSADLCEWVVEEASAAQGWAPEEVPAEDLVYAASRGIQTEYEARFREEGREVHHLNLRRDAGN